MLGQVVCVSRREMCNILVNKFLVRDLVNYRLNNLHKNGEFALFSITYCTNILLAAVFHLSFEVYFGKSHLFQNSQYAYSKVSPCILKKLMLEQAIYEEKRDTAISFMYENIERI